MSTSTNQMMRVWKNILKKVHLTQNLKKTSMGIAEESGENAKEEDAREAKNEANLKKDQYH